MRKMILTMTAVAVSLLAVPALAQTPPAGGGMMGGAGRGPQMSESARIMQFINQKGMTAEQVQAERAKMRGMAEADRAKLTADLEAQWGKLTSAQQVAYKAEWEAAAAARGAGRPGQ